MRDAVALEARGIPTVILVNDVFAPIAHATAALLDLPADYVSTNIVWLPHPTSNLKREAAAALIDERIARIRAAFLGRAHGLQHEAAATLDRDPLTLAREIVEGLAQSLRTDGAELALLSFQNGILDGELLIGDVTCEDGACIMPTEQLAKMVDALVRPKLASLREVALREVRHS